MTRVWACERDSSSTLSSPTEPINDLRHSNSWLIIPHPPGSLSATLRIRSTHVKTDSSDEPPRPSWLPLHGEQAPCPLLSLAARLHPSIGPLTLIQRRQPIPRSFPNGTVSFSLKILFESRHLGRNSRLVGGPACSYWRIQERSLVDARKEGTQWPIPSLYHSLVRFLSPTVFLRWFLEYFCSSPLGTPGSSLSSSLLGTARHIM